MADRVKIIDAEIKATQRLASVQKELDEAREKGDTAAITRLEKLENKISAFIKKADGIKNSVNEIDSLSSSISLSTRSSDSLSSALTGVLRQVKALSRVQIDISSNETEAQFIENITDAAKEILNAQSNMLSLTDATAQEQAEAKAELDFYSAAFSSYVKDNKELLKTNSQINSLVQDLSTNINKASTALNSTIGLTEAELVAYKDLTAEADAFGARLKGIAAMIGASLKKPMVLAGLAVVGVGKALGKWGESVRSFGGYVDSAQISTFLLGAAFDDAEDVAKGLAEEMGGLKDVTLATQLNTNLMALNMGISGKEAAQVVGSFARLNNMSAETAADMAATTKSMAKAAGVPVDAVMKDVAANSEAFAEYGKDGGTNIAKAAVSAAKLGVSMSALTKVTDSLLDFETSINNEMELGAMLGKNINLDRARALAYEGNIGGAVKETLASLGGIEEFNKMDIFQKRKAAELLGLSVDEFQKMAANSEKLNDDGTIQLSTFDTLLESATAIATGPLASMVSTLGTGITLAGQLGTGFQAIGGPLKNMAGSVWDWVSGLIKGKAVQATMEASTTGADVLTKAASTIAPENIISSSATSAAETAAASAETSIASTIQEKAGEKIEGVVDDKIGAVTSPEGVEEATESVNKDKSMGDKLKDLSKGLKSMGNTQVLFGALNLIPTGLGFLAMLPGIPSLFLLSKMDISGVGKGLENLAKGMKKMADGAVFVGALALVVAAGAFAIMTVGAIGMAAIALLGAPAGAGLIALGKGLKSFGNNALKGVAVLGLLTAVIGLSAIAFQQFAAVDFEKVMYGGIALAAFAVGVSILGKYADKIIAGSLAITTLGIALIPFTYAMSLFAGVDFESVTYGGIALAAFAVGASVIGKFSDKIIAGSLALAALGIALIPFTYAMSLLVGLDMGSVIAAAAGLAIFGAAVFGLGALMMTGAGAFVFGAGILALLALGAALVVLGAGLNLVGSGFSAIASGLPAIIDQISALSTIDFLPILGLAGALTTLSIALAAVAATGMMALPALLALGLIAGATAAVVGGGGDNENQKMDELIGEIKGLRADMAAGKIGINMDGAKVTARISGHVDKIGGNSYAKV